MRPAPRRTATTALLALAAACASDADAPTAPDDSRFDAAQVVRGSALPAAAGGPIYGDYTGGAAALAAPAPEAFGQCAWNDAGLHFACAPHRAAGVTFTYVYTPFDADGRVQRVPDRATTDRVYLVGRAQGLLVVPGTPSAVITQQRRGMVGGLLSGTRTFNGDVIMTVSRSGAPGETVQILQEVADVVFPVPGAAWPSAGVVFTTLVRGGVRQARTVVRFNGTGTVPLEFTADGRARQCTLDLGARAGSGVRCPGE